jgi:uncharacterized RDD family membrane protein YckC
VEDRYTVDTPENIEFGYDIAGIGSRMLAAIIDTSIILALQAIILLLGSFATDSAGLAESVRTALATIAGFMILWGYYIAFEVIWNGQSPGKRALGLRVVRTGGRPITFTAAVIRNLVRLVDFLPFFYGIGVVVMFVDSRSRRLGDLAAGVIVVRERREITLASLTAQGDQARIDLSSAPEIPGILALRAGDYQLIREFLDQRTTLGGDARKRIAQQLARGIEARLAIVVQGDPEPFLEQVALAYRAALTQAEQPQQAG